MNHRMGIPSYFSLILRKYKQIITNLQHVTDDGIAHLFMDCNSIIYDAYHEHMKQPTNESTSCGGFSEQGNIEQVLCHKVVEKIETLIQWMKPTQTIYIAFDGVAPMAKMKQQRARRCKGVYWVPPGTGGFSEPLEKLRFSDRSGIEKPRSSFDFTELRSVTSKDDEPDKGEKLGPKKFLLSSITPGTAFMTTLMSAIRTAFVGKEKHYRVNRLIVSTSEEPGEGEHKLFQYIRSIVSTQAQDVSVVYGLDADLIMLALYHVERMKNIFVCREPIAFNGIANNNNNNNNDPSPLLFMDIALLKTSIYSHITCQEGSDASLVTENTPKRVVDDYMFLCFLLGNDFLPHFPTLNLRTHGMDILLDTYRLCLWKHGKHVVDAHQGLIIWKNVHIMFQKWAKMEHELLLQEHHTRDVLAKKLHQTHAKRPALEQWNNIPLLYRMEETYICPQETHWQQRYYRSLFPGNPPIQQICQQYYEGLEWVFRYYTSDCPDWRWKYDFSYPPLFEDLILCGLPIQKRCHPYQHIPVTPTEQLLYVLPPVHHYLIPGMDGGFAETGCGVAKPVEKCRERCVFAYCRYFWEAHTYV